MIGRSIVKAIIILRLLVEKLRERRDLHMFFKFREGLHYDTKIVHLANSEKKKKASLIIIQKLKRMCDEAVASVTVVYIPLKKSIQGDT